MNNEDMQILIVVLFAIAIVVASIIWGNKSEANANKYCFEKYQNLEEIKTCKEIFYK